MGKDVILVETVGVGQDEVEVASLAHTVVVVTVPGLGDDVQAIKAGVLEIADVFAVNKADREGADRTVRDLQIMLELRRTVATRPPRPRRAAPVPRRRRGAAAGPGRRLGAAHRADGRGEGRGDRRAPRRDRAAPRAPRGDRRSAARARWPGRGRRSWRCCASGCSRARSTGSRRRWAGSTRSPSGSRRARRTPTRSPRSSRRGCAPSGRRIDGAKGRLRSAMRRTAATRAGPQIRSRPSPRGSGSPLAGLARPRSPRSRTSRT